MKVYIETYGCTANLSDSSGIRDAVLASGWSIAERADDADVVIINTCAVTQHTSRAMLKAIKHHPGKRIIVTGCMAATQPELLKDIEHADSPGADPVARMLGLKAGKGRIPLTIIGKTAIIPISEGCRGNCSYCIVRLARGRLRSNPPRAVLDNVRKALLSGAKEIFITSQDTGAYGMDGGQMRLPGLIKEITRIPGDYKIRLGMMNPFSIADIVPDMIDVFNDPRVYRFAHIPVQSGSDRILKLMRRPYTSGEYRNIVAQLRESVPDITFSTDYIVGFPTETDEDFKLTMEDLRINRPLKVNITRYSPRPGTIAATMPDILERVKKERSRMLTDLHHQITSSYMRMSIGKKLTVRVSEPGKAGSVIARDDSYNMVVIKNVLDIGAEVEVEICGAMTTYMIGKVVNN